MGSMKLIAITPPYFYRGEAQAIERALTADGGFDRVHIRKPGATESEMRALIDAIDPALRPRLTLHDCLSLAPELGAGGVHLNSRNQSAPEGWSGFVSRSTHSLAEAQEAAATGLYSYIFLSPVYPSISKPGYFPPFTLDDLRGRLPRGIYALGGVTRSRLDALEAAGFEGAAMLGAAWRREIDPEAFSLQFITHGDTPDEVAQGALAAVEGGCRWVQIRMKGAGAAEVEQMALRLAPVRRQGVTLLVDDHVELAARLSCLDGVHVGKNDMPVAEARRLLGPGKILGATANTLADLEAAARAGADYVGLGPFRFTTTKKNLSPVLGADGYRTIMAACRRDGIALPVVAIGGITGGDIPDILNAGVQGIAVSGTILRAESPAAMTARLVSTIQQHLKI